MRDDNYLQGRLDYLWDRYFSDIDQANDVVIKFGKKAVRQLGSIKQSLREPIITNYQYPITNQSSMTNVEISKKNNPTTITITGYFKDELVPEFIVDSVIAHEMVHYAHGFASPHEKKHENPHAGGVIKAEMQERGLEDLFILQKKWLKTEWKKFLEENYPTALKRRVVIRRRKSIFRIF